MRKIHLLVTLVFLCCTSYTMACTNFLFTKGATKDGSTMITYSADSHVLYGELYHWPAQDWPAGYACGRLRVGYRHAADCP